MPKYQNRKVIVETSATFNSPKMVVKVKLIILYTVLTMFLSKTLLNTLTNVGACCHTRSKSDRKAYYCFFCCSKCKISKHQIKYQTTKNIVKEKLVKIARVQVCFYHLAGTCMNECCYVFIMFIFNMMFQTRPPLEKIHFNSEAYVTTIFSYHGKTQSQIQSHLCTVHFLESVVKPNALLSLNWCTFKENLVLFKTAKA